MKVTLLTPHTHAGTEYQAGESITVPEDTAVYLDNLQIGFIPAGSEVTYTPKSPISRKATKKERKP